MASSSTSSSKHSLSKTDKSSKCASKPRALARIDDSDPMAVQKAISGLEAAIACLQSVGISHNSTTLSLQRQIRHLKSKQELDLEHLQGILGASDPKTVKLAIADHVGSSGLVLRRIAYPKLDLGEGELPGQRLEHKIRYCLQRSTKTPAYESRCFLARAKALTERWNGGEGMLCPNCHALVPAVIDGTQFTIASHASEESTPWTCHAAPSSSSE